MAGRVAPSEGKGGDIGTSCVTRRRDEGKDRVGASLEGS